MRLCNRPLVAVPLIVAIVLTLCAPRAGALGQEFIPLENWSYHAVERFEALGLCVVPEDRPLTRTEFIELVSEISKKAFERRLAPRDRYNLERLEKEFTNFASQRDAQHRYDPPTFYLPDAPLLLEGDVDIIGAFERAAQGEQLEEFFARSNPDFKIHYGDRVTYNVRYRLELGPEHGDRARDRKPSRREKSFKGLTALYERSYVIAAWNKLHVFLGREAVDWGPADWGNLITPGERHTLDQLGLRLRLKQFRLSMFHAQLSPSSRRYLAGHRLEARWKRWVLGVSETAVYGGREPDPVYSFPLSTFYGNQFNERTNEDNIFWSVDVKGSLFDRVTLYGSFLMDDFQFERGDNTPDKIAFDVGGRLALDVPLAATLRAKYRYVDIFTYTHFDSVGQYISGEGRLDEGDVILGGEPGPDSDAWRIEVEVFPRKNLVATATVFGQRRGGGNDFRIHEPGTDPNPGFPRPNVERTRGYLGELRYEFDRNRYVVGEVGHVSVHNVGGVVDLDDDGVSFRLAIHWEFL